jgi:ubiquinone/menaquinone biosynthesis C-methylase UbiE
MSHAEAWKRESAVRAYLDGVRGAIPLAQEQIDAMLRLIDAAGVPVTSVADLGCGDGTLAAAVLDRYPTARATLVDFSAPMLREARTRFAGRSEEQVAIVAGDLSQAAWKASVRDRAPFDAVVSGFAIHHLTDARKRALYAEVLELLSPGGFFLNLEHVSSPTAWLTGVFDDLLIDGYEQHHRAAGSRKTRAEIASEYVHREDREANILASVDDQCGWLRDLGYLDVDCYFKLFELAVFGGRKPD